MLLRVEVELEGNRSKVGKTRIPECCRSRKANGMPEDDSRVRKERVVRFVDVEDDDERVCVIRIAYRTGACVNLLGDDVSKIVTNDVNCIDSERPGSRRVLDGNKEMIIRSVAQHGIRAIKR